MTTLALAGSLPESLQQALRDRGLELREAALVDHAHVVVAAGSAVVGPSRTRHAAAVIVGVCEPNDWASTLHAGAHLVVPHEPNLLVAAAEHARAIASDRAALDAYRKAEALTVPGTKLAELEQAAILAAMRASQGSTARAAAMLDISVRKVQYKLHEYGMPPTRKRAESEARWGTNGDGPKE